jgi:hypothetical protein
MGGAHQAQGAGGKCGPRSVPAVSVVLAKHAIRAEALPPKVTSALPVMDLVVNGPLKAAIRRARIDALSDNFQLWRSKRLQTRASPLRSASCPPIRRRSPRWRAVSAPSCACHTTFTQTGFRAGLQRIF